MNEPDHNSDASITNTDAESVEPDSGSLGWTVWLVRNHPWRGLLAGAVSGYTVWFTWSYTSSGWLAGFAAFVMLASLSSFFLPTSYAMDGEKVMVKNPIYRRTRKWDEFRGMKKAGDKLKLTTFSRDSRLDNYRGMLLLLPPQADEIIDFIRQRLEERELDSATE
jgi:hypothetical protein